MRTRYRKLEQLHMELVRMHMELVLVQHMELVQHRNRKKQLGLRRSSSLHAT